MPRKRIFLYFGMYVVSYCGYAQFDDVTVRMELSKSTVSLSLMGGGASFVDYDNDGLMDIYLVGGDDPDYLFRNTGQGTYEDVSSDTFITQFSNGFNTTAVATGDINNDGCC